MCIVRGSTRESASGADEDRLSSRTGRPTRTAIIFPGSRGRARGNGVATHTIREMPAGIELHFCLWNAHVSLIEIPEVERFWERRVNRRMGNMEFCTLHPVDQLGYLALHILRGVLTGDWVVHHVLELATFLHNRTRDVEFWSQWHEMHSANLRGLEALAFGLARNWFSCALPEVVRVEVDRLPPGQQRWLRRFGGAPLEVMFRHNKDGRLLAVTADALADVAAIRAAEGDVSVPRARAQCARGTHSISPRATRREEELAGSVRQVPGQDCVGQRRSRHCLSFSWRAVVGLHTSAQRAILGISGRMFFFDFGVSIYFFFFNLFLSGHGYSETQMGLITGTMAAGNLAGALPAATAHPAKRFANGPGRVPDRDACCAVRAIDLAFISATDRVGVLDRPLVVHVGGLRVAHDCRPNNRARTAARLQPGVFARHRRGSARRAGGKQNAGVVFPRGRQWRRTCARSVDVDCRLRHRRSGVDSGFAASQCRHSAITATGIAFHAGHAADFACRWNLGTRHRIVRPLRKCIPGNACSFAIAQRRHGLLHFPALPGGRGSVRAARIPSTRSAEWRVYDADRDGLLLHDAGPDRTSTCSRHDLRRAHGNAVHGRARDLQHDDEYCAGGSKRKRIGLDGIGAGRRAVDCSSLRGMDVYQPGVSAGAWDHRHDCSHCGVAFQDGSRTRSRQPRLRMRTTVEASEAQGTRNGQISSSVPAPACSPRRTCSCGQPGCR